MEEQRGHDQQNQHHCECHVSSSSSRQFLAA
jgi:hypothetical protein